MPSSAPTDMSALTAPAMGTLREVESAPNTRAKGRLAPRGLHPTYVWDLLWEEDRYPAFQASAELSEDVNVTIPMPSPPSLSSFTPEYLNIIADHLELFKVVTPIDMECFDFLLSDHPNQAFVTSVVHMLREGAWPWAAPPTHFPLIHDVLYLGTCLHDGPDLKSFMEAEWLGTLTGL